MSVLLTLCVILCSLSPLAFADNRNLTVYIASESKSAYRYHAKSSCSSLSRSIVSSVTLEEAASRGFTPCTKCHPPEPDFDISATPRPKTSSGNSSSVSTPKPSPVPKTPEPSSIPKQPVQAKKNTDFPVIPSAVALIAGGAIIKGVSTKRKRQKQQAKEAAERKKQWEVERAHYISMFGDRSTLTLAGAPPNCYIGSDMLPACKDGQEKWGNGYTVYMTSSGQAYHSCGCRIIKKNYSTPVNAYSAKTGYRWYKGIQRFHPCSYCQPVLPDLTWYERYKEIKSIREKYEIPEPKCRFQ